MPIEKFTRLKNLAAITRVIPRKKSMFNMCDSTQKSILYTRDSMQKSMPYTLIPRKKHALHV